MNIYSSINDKNVAIRLSSGEVGILPSDTLYGLMAQAAQEAAVEKLYQIKKRDDKPGTIIGATIDQFVQLGIKRRYLTAVEQYWPNPLSIVIPTGLNLGYLHRGKQSLALRIPNDTKLLDLLKKTGPLATTSANLPSKEPASNITDAQKIFGEAVDFYVDGGDLSGREPSTVIQIVDDAIEVLREGAVKINESGRIEN